MHVNNKELKYATQYKYNTRNLQDFNKFYTEKNKKSSCCPIFHFAVQLSIHTKQLFTIMYSYSIRVNKTYGICF